MTAGVRVAVVVPCFNDGGFIGEALGSLTGQEAHELVVVDDGSHDPYTLEILDGLRQVGVNVVTKPNGGLGPARMTGVAATTAPYIHPLDSDDLLVPGALKTLADALDAHPGAAASWGRYRTFGASDCTFPTAPTLDPWRITFLDEIPGTSMVRRTALEAFGGWERVTYEDWDYWMRLAGNGASGVGVPELTLLYREHSTPRLLAQTTANHAEHFQGLRDRHRDLFAARRRNWRSSPSPLALKLLLPLIDAVPGLPETHKRQLWGMARYLVQRDMSSDCYRGPLQRVCGRLRPATAAPDPIDAASRRRRPD